MDDNTKELINKGEGTLKKQLRDAIKEHQQLIMKHREIRLAYLQEKLIDLNEREPDKNETSLSTLINRETKRADFAKLRTVFKKGKGKGITTLEVPNENGTGYRNITEPTIINNKLLHRNINHFAQAHNKPFTIHPIQKWFEYEGTNSTVVKLIKDQLLPDNIEDLPIYVQEILKQLASGNNLEELSDEIIFDKFIAALSKWNERTTTSPSGRHLGHYKLLTRLYIFDDNDHNLSQQILFLYYQIAMIAVKTGNSLNRWCNVTTCMIEKIRGVARIDKLRIIHIYEADYNLLLKIMSRKSFWNCHDKDVLHNGQSGSRPGKRAIEVVINKELKYLYSKLTRTPLGTIDNDAKSCYDRIILAVAMPICGYFGLPINYLRMQANTLKMTKFRLSTAMGESKETYQHSDDTPIYGTGQGSCASPSIWLFISSFLMMILEKEAHGMHIYDILKDKKEIVTFIEGFVDDTSIFSNNKFNNTDLISLKEHLKQDGTWWAGLLEATGGKLELQKCFYYLLTWKFNKKGNASPQPTTEQHDNHNKIQVDHNNKNNIPLQQKDIKTSHKTLGTFKTVTGCEKDHYKYLLNKSNDYAEMALFGQLSRRQTKLAYTYNYIPALSYSLTAMCLSEQQLESIQQKALTQFIRLMGYEACFPLEVLSLVLNVMEV
jgi:Reverse transcriptase (RNA-dependent DNA polymerase)